MNEHSTLSPNLKGEKMVNSNQIFLIIIFFLLLFSGCNKNDPPICAYCGSKIYYQESEKFFLMESPQIKIDNNYYHPWCFKIKKLESKIDSLTKEQ